MLYEVITGVAALHTALLKKDLFHDFDQLFPGKIRNKTNGITPRRWLLACNQNLSKLINEKIGARITSYNVCYTKLLRS